MRELLYSICLGASTALAQAVAPLPVPAPASTIVRPLPATPTGTGLYVPRTSTGEPLNEYMSPEERPTLKARLEHQRKEESDALKRRSAELVTSECKQGAGLGYGLVIQLGDAYAYHLEMSR